MNLPRKAFTLIELIIVVVVIGILALVAIPRYFANVAKAQKAQVYANLDAIRQALLAYYAVNGVYPTPCTWPIIVTLDGDTIINLARPGTSIWQYGYNNDTNACTVTPWMYGEYHPNGGAYSCQYGLCMDGTMPCMNCCTT
ncbi:MAG: prepilin-type N-terminal cleavage/methylation domain-containing protein [Candidatus Omnitrophica bacterium]|jgi:prepilin-type N-terminal cleavage/methylation domain-containing protein|nr:prepilin-type N-terminal cleavage/methylation domain-containing protein [Candidatus Omnitrophota bacterium]MDD5026921.1 prepilin-type N-terminal cleavage/methylation domain-containing protein [Candidatus Omnitrophota bacterium]